MQGVGVVIPGVTTVPGVAYEIDRLSGVPSYRQLADLLRADIERGTIQPGRTLPSLVRLVQETGLDVKTVRHAIGVLADAGLVRTIPGRGTFVLPRPD